VMWIKQIIFFASISIALGQYRGYNSNDWVRSRGNGYVANWPPRQWRPPQQYPQYPSYTQYRPYPGQYPQYQQGYPQQTRPWWNTKEKMSDVQPMKIGFGPDPDLYKNPYPSRRVLYNQYIDPSTIPQVRPNCQARRCYYFCRLKLLGGGRCTGGGCMCYAGFFAYDGSPLTRQYPEDDLWFDLTSDEQTQIRTEMARFSAGQQINNLVPNKPNGGNSGKPDYIPGGHSNSGKPDYNPGGNTNNQDWNELYPENDNNPGGNSGKPDYNPGGNSGKPDYIPGGNSGKPSYENSNTPGGSEGSGTGLDWNNNDDESDEEWGNNGYDEDYDEEEEDDFWG